MTARPNDSEVRAYLAEYFNYDPLTGLLTRIKSRYQYAVGQPVSHRIRGEGYIFCTIKNHLFAVHRVAWFLTHGAWPARELDHINGDITDNRLANLREATPSQNQWNKRRRKDNTSGFKGVYRTKSGKFGARIKQFDERIHLGTFDTPEEAHAAYCAAATARFGEFANFGAHRSGT